MTRMDAQIEKADQDALKRRGWDWSLNRWGNRAVYSLAAGAVVNYSTGATTVGTVVTVVLFVLTTAIVTSRR